MTNFVIETDEALGLWGAILAFMNSGEATVEGIDRLLESAKLINHADDRTYITRYLERKRDGLMEGVKQDG